MIALTKHHGLGNDFLVLVDSSTSASMSTSERAALAKASCDRHTGVGADGLLFVLPIDHPDAPPTNPTDDAQIAMRLHNADGSIAEMSGNGIRCFTQAVVDANLVPDGTVRIATDGGLRIVEGKRSDTSGLAMFRVAMGIATVDTIAAPTTLQERLANLRALTVDVGNPHIVIECANLGDLDIATFGPFIEELFLAGPTKGINVEVIEPPAHTDVIDMVVWERGVGVTQACGTGACATAVAARKWGFVGASSTIQMPGGAVSVELGPNDEVTLIGPSQFICALTFAWTAHSKGNK